jgi:hypothetical protein
VAAETYNITIEKGATFSRQIQLSDADGADYNLTGFTASAQIRESHSSSAVVATFTTTISTPATDGIINMSLTAAQTAELSVPNSKEPEFTTKTYIYDLIITHTDTRVIRLLQGEVTVVARVTR